jgi:spore maturation protein CgeB
MKHSRILVVGGPTETSIGKSFVRAARALGYECMFLDQWDAFQAPSIIRKLNWHLRGHLPTHLRSFSSRVEKTALINSIDVILSTGVAPIDADALGRLHQSGIEIINYSTDDPFGNSHRAQWFLSTLPLYDTVFTPRQSNIEEFRAKGVRNIVYLPFGYDEDLFFPPPDISPETAAHYASDVLFVGGADGDRIPFIESIIENRMNIGLYGGQWGKYPATKMHHRGEISVAQIRLATKCAKIALCLVRKSNRDGNSMRTYEVPAIGACMLVERTDDHEILFGKEGEAVLYFTSKDEMVMKMQWLLAHETERAFLAEKAHSIIVEGGHTYRDRLISILTATR